MNKKLVTLQKTLGKFYIPFISILFMLIAFLIGYPSVKPKEYAVTLNQVATETIRANRTVEDKEQTEQNRKLAADSIADVYRYDDTIAKKQLENVTSFFTAIRATLAKSSSEILATTDATTSSDSITKESTNTVVAKAEDRTTYFKKSLNNTNSTIKEYAVFIPDKVLISLFSSDTTLLERYEKTVKTSIETFLAKSVPAATLATVREEAQKQLYYEDYTDAEREVLNQLLNISIVSNNVVDAEATQAAKTKASESVVPVRLLQGQVIVQEGQIVDQNVMNQLTLLGLVNGQPKYHVLIGYSVLLLLIVIIFLVDSIYEKRKQSVLYQQLTAVYVLMIISLLCIKILQSIQISAIEEISLLFPMAGVVYLVMHTTKVKRYGLLTAIFLVALTGFIFNEELNVSQLVAVMMYDLFASFIGYYAFESIENKKTFRQFSVFVSMHAIVLMPFLLFMNDVLISKATLWWGGFSLVAGVLSYIIPVVTIPYLDLVFEDSSFLLLTKLSNPNQPLLKELIVKAPGTYQHSLMVANISANCVEAIGGNSLLARVACYYHDIGKAENPLFFIENLPAHMESPHKLLTPEESKEIIFAHVTRGVEILTEQGLPQSVIDICAQHHGTTLMKYFYVEALKTNPDVTEEEFRYPGPKPQTKEAAIINIVDSAEAATRAMKEPTIEKVKELVHGIIVSRMDDGQLSDSDLTTKELAIVEKMTVASLNGTFHSRIAYPNLPKKEKQGV